jgi:plasmid stabilization system protein ParE
MSFRIVFVNSAEHDLKELKRYMVKNFGSDTWQVSYARIKDAVNTIRTFPLGGDVPEVLERLHLTQYRQVVAGKNRVIYEVRQDTIYIHIVCDTRKDLTSLLSRRLVRIVEI